MKHLAMRSQCGVTLFVALVMLIVLTLFAITAFNLASVNLRIIGNFQQQKATEAVVQHAIEQVLSSISLFSSPAEVNLCVPSATLAPCAASDHTVTVNRPRCNYVTTAKGYTKRLGELTPQDTHWEIRATYTDATTGASAALTQGVAVRMLAGNCPTWPY